jgi:hypothetical protein
VNVPLAFAGVFLAFAALVWAIKRLLDSTDVTISFSKRSSEEAVDLDLSPLNPNGTVKMPTYPQKSSPVEKVKRVPSERHEPLPRRVRDQLPDELS